MKPLKIITLFLILSTLKQLNANALVVISANDSLTLGEAFVNLSLTGKYFDTLKIDRITKIIRFEEKELTSITDTVFIKNNARLYNFTYSLLYYAKAKQLFLNKKDISRKRLLLWKNTLDISIDYFNKADIDVISNAFNRESFYQYLGFTDETAFALENNIKNLKHEFTPFFCHNIYPDFKRLFFQVKKTNRFNFKSLLNYSNIFNFELEPNIIKLIDADSYLPEYSEYKYTNEKRGYVNKIYQIDDGLDLISRYLQLDFIARKYKSLCKIEYILSQYQELINIIELGNSSSFLYYKNIPKDDFFRVNILSIPSSKLFEKLSKITKPNKCPEVGRIALSPLPDHYNEHNSNFPTVAPFPSVFKYFKNYKSSIQNLKQVDNELKVVFDNAGYKNHIQYYYVKSGFAITTSLEGITKDGEPVDEDKRWNVDVDGYNKFSLYETYKAIFFDTKSNFRIFAFIISPSEISTEKVKSSNTSSRLLDMKVGSIPSFPKDMEDKILPQKVLTVLVYNFYQSDIGQVPTLDINHKLSVEKHLEKSGLAGLLNN